MKKILLIEDDNLVATVYRNKFIQEGFQVEIATDGEQGYDTLERFRPDAVLLDLMLPKLPGIDLIKKIRSQTEFQTLPLIVFTNSFLSSTIQEAWKAGATKCLTKSSCTPNQVIGTVLGVLNSGGAAQPQPPQPAPAAAKEAAKTPAKETITIAPIRENAPEDDSEVQLRKAFTGEFPATITALRTNLQTLIKATTDTVRLQHLDKMYRRVHLMTGNAGLIGIAPIAQLADALEALIKELFEKPQSINASTLRTIASAVDCLAVLFEKRAEIHDENASAKILVVDDDAISRRAVTHALEKADLKSTNVEDSTKAFDLITQVKFDLIFLDVDMPNMNGYELCAKVRRLPAYKKTPIVFVTGLNDFEARANSTISGGNDFIAKPFLFIELSVKALIYVLRNRLHRARN